MSTTYGITSAKAQPYSAVPFDRVVVDDAFWAPRQEINREHTIPHIYRQLVETGRIGAFRPDWDPDEATRRRDSWGGTAVMFWDSDVAKWLEAASNSLALHPDPDLDALLDDLIARIASVQHADGYLNTWFTGVDPEGRWKNLRDWHELYCAGHLFEAGVAHFEATGKRSLLDVCCRYADYIDTVFGPREGQLRGYCGHPEIELALIRLARATGEDRYLALARYFVDERGRQPLYFDVEALARGENPQRFWARSYEYNQAHLPVREQPQVVGHAVRAVYLYSAMADLAGIDGDTSLLEACRRLWTHLTTTRMYVMGGIGTSRSNEGFTHDYDLPNQSAYAETCAAIGLVFWAKRMLQIDLDRRYADILELALYNAVLSGVSADGTAFFYDNPLASRGDHHRVPWFGCPCCPPNLARILAGLGEYIYAQNDHEALVHLYAGSATELTLSGQQVALRQETRYPWDGHVRLAVEPAAPTRFTLRLRIPGWCKAPQASLNGNAIELTQQVHNGYLVLERTWQPGDVVTLELPMPIERVYAHPAVSADVGQVALQRGPIVYSVEQIDVEGALEGLAVSRAAELQAAYEPELLGGVVTIGAPATTLEESDWNGTLYRNAPPQERATQLRAIPYFAWDGREAGAMRVWVRESDAPAQ